MLLEFLDCLNAVTTVDDLLAQSAGFVSRVFRPVHCALWAGAENVSGLPASQPFLGISQALHRHIASMNSLVVISNPAQDVLTAGLAGAKDLKCNILALPVRLNARHFATLVLGSQETLVPVSRLVSVLMDRLSIALARAFKLEEAQHSAMTDALTQLYNKAYFLEALKNEVARSRRSQRPISLLMFDIDNFKEFNDANGHIEGDRLLAGLGALVKQNVRAIDVPARYGGEEFAVILPETGHDSAFAFAERIRSIVAEKCAATVSIGIATCLNASVSPESLLKESDRALYAAKRNGKNQSRAFIIIDRALGVIDVQQASSVGKA